MKIIILSSAFSGLAQRFLTELNQLNHNIEQHYDLNEDVLRHQVKIFKPDVIVCPFLTQRIPDDIWRTCPCLIVHPGIEGDCGPSSLDWAISAGKTEWGVTLLQAGEKFDSGDIWGTRTFAMRTASKTSLYKREVTEAAVELIKQALVDMEFNNFVPRMLDYNAPHVKGCDRPPMKQTDRSIVWEDITTDEVLRRLNGADSRPGICGVINGYQVNMYGGIAEPDLRGTPGDIIAIHNDAFCCACKDGAVWIKQLKCSQLDNLAPIKLPANIILEKICTPDQLSITQCISSPSPIDDIRVELQDDNAYVYFNFYNGAFNTRQCMALKNILFTLKNDKSQYGDVQKIILMGGVDFWSNGIHLNCIEAADDPALESWNNINAIDDLVREIIESPNHITIAALRNNAGAGGAVMAMACDQVIIRKGVVLNPHYQSMGLYGSEYWTYILPGRVGEANSLNIMKQCQPMLADEAINIGVADMMFEENWDRYHHQLKAHCRQLDQAVNIAEYLSKKKQSRARDEANKPLEHYRHEELAKMKKTFYDPASSYHEKRMAFVYKKKIKPLQVDNGKELCAQAILRKHKESSLDIAIT